MSLARVKKKRDKSEPAIVAVLRKVRAKVYRIDQPADLLVGYGQRWILIECKSHTYARPDQAHQRAAMCEARSLGLPWFICHTPEEALEAIGLRR